MQVVAIDDDNDVIDRQIRSQRVDESNQILEKRRRDDFGGKEMAQNGATKQVQIALAVSRVRRATIFRTSLYAWPRRARTSSGG